MRYYFTIFDMKVPRIPPQMDALKWLIKVVASMGFIVETYAQKAFLPPVPGNAYTIAAVLSESHAVIHTVPEDSWVEVVFALCKEVPPGKLLEKVREFWEPSEVDIKTFTGQPPGEV